MKHHLLRIIAVTGALAASVIYARAGVGVRSSALDASAWEAAEWISAAEAPVVTDTIKDGVRAADGASWFYGTVRNRKKVVKATWMVTSLGVFDIQVNGQSIGDEVLRPGFTHPLKTRRSFTYDVTDAYVCGKGKTNTLSAQVTPGWWADKIVSPSGITGFTGKKCALRAVLELTYSDGSTELVGTSAKDWKAGIAGPVRHAAIFDGEVYDAREKAGYLTPELLGAAEQNEEFKGEILPSEGAEVFLRKDLALTPIKSYIWKGVSGQSDSAYGKVVIIKEFNDGEKIVLQPGETLVVDFGQNCAAVPEFVFSAAEGTTLHCEMSELLNDGNGSKERGMDGPEGSVHRLNLRIPDTGMMLDYTFAASSGDVTYRPGCTFYGYRLVSITATGEVSISSIRSIPVSSISKEMETGSISTSNMLINKLISNTIWGQRSNYLSIPTDCPQRNERLGWTADTQVFTETGTFFANTDAFFHKWMRDMRDSQSQTGGFPGVAPWGQYGGDMMRVGWADAGVIVPWTVWKQFADNGIVDENWEAMVKFMDHVNETRYDHMALKQENKYYQWADWLSYEPLESCSRRAHELTSEGVWQAKAEAKDYWSYLSACYWAMDAVMMSDMAKATGRDAARYDAMAAEAKAYIKGKWLKEDGSFVNETLNTMQTPALFALRNNLVEGEAKDAMIARLRQNFKEHDNCLQTGFLGTSILMQTLTDNGMADIAWSLLFQRRNPSWLYSVDNGASTIWERWNSYTIDGGMGPNGMNSFNHYAYGCVCEWIWETAAGIAADPAQPGFRHIIMKPVPDKRLGHLDAEYKSAAGTIRSSWHYVGKTWTWTFTVPDGASASVTLPGESVAREYGPGTYTVEKEQ